MRILFIIRDLEAGEPLGIMYISALLRQHGHQVKFLGTRGVDLIAEVKAFAPRVIGYGVCTGQHNYYLGLNRWLKRSHSFLSVFGGPHATFFPEMVEEEGVDVVCRGEGEYAMLELCERLEAEADIAGIPNLWVKTAGAIARNAPRPLVGDLDDLPFPDRESRYAADPKSRDYLAQSFLTSRGCPYCCAYCFNPSMRELYGASWARRRTRSVASVISEIESVKARAPALGIVQFRCSMFPYEVDWLEKFAGEYSRRVGLPFYCHVRADHMSERVVELMAAAGCRSVNMGIECDDEVYRRDVLKRPMANSAIAEACERLRRHGIAILADNIVGLPGRGFEDDMRTLRLNARCGVDYPLAMILQPYPGTAIDRYARDNGYFDGDYSDIDYNYYLCSPLRFGSEREKRRIENLQKLFALGVEMPFLLPIIRRLVDLPPNLIYNSIFRCWFIYCYHQRIMPHRLGWRDKVDILMTIFGVYAKEAFYEDGPENC